MKIEGYKVVDCQCSSCGHRFVSVSPESTPVNILQCPKCMQQGQTSVKPEKEEK